mmetsp:Transcript_37305/g.89328  ORF Transcript_37305/g.89328 Transcript_37305/m.89328 type:complete len:81 (-) Transcript_37305:151-393(-)
MAKTISIIYKEREETNDETIALHEAFSPKMLVGEGLPLTPCLGQRSLPKKSFLVWLQIPLRIRHLLQLLPQHSPLSRHCF